MRLLQVGLGDHEVALDHVQGLVTEDGLQGKDVGVNAKLPECGPCMGAKAVDNSRISCYANSVGSVKAGLRISALSLFPLTLSSAASFLARHDSIRLPIGLYCRRRGDSTGRSSSVVD